MTISTAASSVTAQGNSATTVWPYAFLIPEASDLVVEYIDANGNITVLDPAVFSVTGLGNAAGGNVTYPLSGSPMAAGTFINIARVLAIVQQTSLADQGGYYPTVVEAMVDDVTMMVQQVQAAVAQAITAPPGTTPATYLAQAQTAAASAAASKTAAASSAGAASSSATASAASAAAAVVSQNAAAASAVLAAGYVVPAQGGNGGKILMTDGAAVSWSGAPTALTSINGGGFGVRNYLPNSSAIVAQRTATINLTTSKQVGQVDCISLHASGGAVSAGTLTQNTAALCGTTGYAAKAAGVTLTGAGVLSATLRMESKDAKKYKNKTCSFQIGVAQDTGGNINYTVILKKANSADNWGAVTTIATSGTTAVVTATGTILKFESQAMGDCSNGIEIEVQAACGAITTKNFDFTEWSLDVGAVAPTFQALPYVVDFAECQRYLPAYSAAGTNEYICMGQVESTTAAEAIFPFAVPPRIAPSGITVSNVTHFALTTAIFSGNPATSNLVFASANTKQGRMTATVASGLVAGNVTNLITANSAAQILFTGAELF